jgi:uncharacterized membrane protein YeaQ/YmgE (transglycosylase-associated protein family)
MSIFVWLSLGLFEGFIASKITRHEDEGFWLDLILGAAGAIIGGLMFTSFGSGGFAALNLFSIIVALAGAIIVLIIYHAMLSRSSF